MAEILQEYVDSHGVEVQVDRTQGVLRGVKLIGLESRNGRRYRESALAQATSLYEEAKVNVNHPREGPLTPRDYQDRLGVIRHVQLRSGDGLYGDLHFNPKHALAEQLMWDAEHNPRNVGFSHNVQARLSRQGQSAVVEEITRVQSVDLVADPAATQGLFEQAEHASGKSKEFTTQWDALTRKTLQLHRPDLLEEIVSSEIGQLRTQLDEANAQTATLERRQCIVNLLCEHRLSIPATGSELHAKNDTTNSVVSQAFFEMLMSLEDQGQLEALIAERAELIETDSGRQKRFANDFGPRSRDQMSTFLAPTVSQPTAQDFAKALKSSNN